MDLRAQLPIQTDIAKIYLSLSSKPSILLLQASHMSLSNLCSIQEPE